MSLGRDEEQVDIAIIGAGAAGLFATIWAWKNLESYPIRIAVFDGAKKLGAKILVAGGGRCNVTHRRVTEHDFAGSSPAAIRKVLRRFTVAQAIQFFSSAGVELKEEETGKLFPVTDSARTILHALIEQAKKVHASLAHPARVTEIEQLTADEIANGQAGAVVPCRVHLWCGGGSTRHCVYRWKIIAQEWLRRWRL